MSKHALIIEDDQSIVTMLNELLLDEGYAVQASYTADALQIAEDNWPDIILLDYKLPLMDGDAFMEYLRHNPLTSHIPVVLMTANPRIEERDGLALGAVAVLKKPFDIGAMQRIIRSVHNREEQA